MKAAPGTHFGHCFECRHNLRRAERTEFDRGALDRRARYTREWRARLLPEQKTVLFRKENLKRNYGITHQQYVLMLASQGGTCAICCQAPDVGKNLHVDHNHKTNEIRGLLCSKCNTAIGLLDEDVRRFESAAEYLTDRRKAEAA
jgi:Recombination endonuclease VII